MTAAAAISNLELALLPTVEIKHKHWGQERARDSSLLTKYDPGVTEPDTVKPTDPVAESKFCDKLVMKLSLPSLPVLYRSTDTKLPVDAGTLVASLHTTQFRTPVVKICLALTRSQQHLFRHSKWYSCRGT